MATKEKTKKKVIRDIGLRLTPDQIKIIDRAVELQAETLGIPTLSRYFFIAGAVMEAAKKILVDAGEKIPGGK